MARPDHADPRPSEASRGKNARSAGTSASGTEVEGALKLLLALGAVAAAALFLVAGAANLGFYDAFGIQDLRIVGIDKSAIIDHSLLLGVILFVLFGAIFAIVLVMAALSRQDWWPQPRGQGRLRTAFEGVLVGTAAVIASIWLVRDGRLVGALLAVPLLALAFATLRYTGRLARAVERRPRAWSGVAVALVALLAMAAFFQGHVWGSDVRSQRRTETPSLAFALIVQWPRGASFDEAQLPCVEDMLLGIRGGAYVLYSPRRNLVHERPVAPMSRTNLRVVRRSECPVPASPASAR